METMIKISEYKNNPMDAVEQIEKTCFIRVQGILYPIEKCIPWQAIKDLIADIVNKKTM